VISRSRAPRRRVRRAERPEHHGRPGRQALGDPLGIGRSLGIGEEQQVRQRLSAHQPWAKARRRSRQGVHLVARVLEIHV
jgi:hypothetical protein